jgi:uncharacterized 2Fe-2S/4Fe-4S cluster protein (DUF4445 family)
MEMKTLVNGELSRLTEELIREAGVAGQTVELVAIAGNPTMSHLLLGIPVDSLAYPPYRPRNTGPHRVRTSELLWGRDLPAYIFPSPGGYVGGDTVAFLYGVGFPATGSIPDQTLFLDLGTNGEIALFAGGKLYATSAAAGPAFEAGNLSSGMAALPGAIYSVRERVGRLETATIANGLPQGLCGSGVLDTVAMLLNEGLLDDTGRLLAPAECTSPLGNHLQEIGGERHFILFRDAKKLVSISQNDIRQVQLAKGAVRGAMEVLFQKAGIRGDDLTKVVLTGSFGASLCLESLKSIGVLSENMVLKADFVREGALAGVLRTLTKVDSEEQIESLAASLKIIPLSGTPLFESHFMENIGFQA